MTSRSPIIGKSDVDAAKLTASNVVMAFGGLRALDGVDFSVPQGGAVGLLGQNGSGKTTLLNVITGHLTPQSGQVTFNGRSMNNLSPDEFAKAGISRVFQTVQIFPRLTVMENLHVARLGQDNRSRLSEEEALNILSRMQLANFADDFARDISYGHQRLLEIAMALAAGAELILLDEPTAGLGPALVESVVGCLRDLNAAGTSMVLIEHETEVVFRVCSQVWVLNEGRVIACGTPTEIRSNQQVLDLYLGAAT